MFSMYKKRSSRIYYTHFFFEKSDFMFYFRDVKFSDPTLAENLNHVKRLEF